MELVDFDSILAENSDYLQPFAISLTKDFDNAQDLLQDTLYRALANKDKYSGGTNVKAWLYTIMRNIFINGYRRKARQETIFDHSDTGYLINHHQLSVNNAAEGNIRLKEIRRAVDQLPSIFKSPFQLYCDGYKYHEIADMMVEPLGTIKSRIHFARKLLKDQLQRA